MISINSGQLMGMLYRDGEQILEEFDGTDSLPLKISGQLIESVCIESKRICIPENELENVARTARGVRIVCDHGKKIKDIVGKIVTAYKKGKQVLFKGLIYNKEVARLIRENLINACSPGLSIGKLMCSVPGCRKPYRSCSHKGNALGRDLSVEELSLTLFRQFRATLFGLVFLKRLMGLFN